MSDDKPPFPGGTPNVPAGTGPITPGTFSSGVSTSNSQNPPKPIPPGAVTAEPMAVPPIALHPKPAVKTQASTTKKDQEPKDSFRELIETVVFVVVLVLMLKTFLAEAFVIPTGSMADTLLGYHYKITCKQCGKPNLVNASSEAEPQGRQPVEVTSAKCENCGFTNILHRGDKP
jgi:hypothetical protein